MRISIIFFLNKRLSFYLTIQVKIFFEFWPDFFEKDLKKNVQFFLDEIENKLFLEY